MKKERKDRDFVKTPYFEGGRAGIDAFVKQQLQYPDAARQAGVEGTVTVRYTVDYKGKVILAEVVSGIGYGCDEEALRIVRLLTFRVPEHGKVKSRYSRKLHIHFRLTKTAPAPSLAQKSGPMSIQYTLQPSTPSAPASAKPSGSRTGFQYTISLPVPVKKK